MAEVQFKCPQCGQMVEADESYCGKVAACPFCGKGIVVPRASAGENVEAIVSNPIPPSPPKRSAPPKPPRLHIRQEVSAGYGKTPPLPNRPKPPIASSIVGSSPQLISNTDKPKKLNRIAKMLIVGSTALVLLGVIFYGGYLYLGSEPRYKRGVTCFKDGDYEKALSYFRPLSEKEHPGAQYRLGKCYLDGLGVEKNVGNAVKLFRRAVEQGLTDAQIQLGLCYDEGMGVDKSAKNAVKWFRKAAEQEDGLALVLLGLCYKHGTGVNKDDDEAASLFDRAVKRLKISAEDGNDEAAFRLGHVYDKGEVAEQDNELALKWYRKSAELGNSQAQYIVGVRYLYGNGVEKDADMAARWFKEAAKRGHIIALLNLAMYYDGKKMHTDALKCFLELANQGQVLSQFKLGTYYEDGTGVEKNPQEAVKWYVKAAENDQKEAQVRLGLCYATGTGVEQDDDQAIAWWDKAKLAAKKLLVEPANHGVVQAQYWLGKESQGNTRLDWYRNAATKGYAAAQAALGDAYELMDENEAMNWWKLAAKQGNQHAIDSIARKEKEKREVAEAAERRKREAAEAEESRKRMYAIAQKERAEHARRLFETVRFAMNEYVVAEKNTRQFVKPNRRS